MGITLSKMASNTAKVVIPVGEDEVNVTYYPQRVTEKLFGSLTVLSDEKNTDVMANATALNDVLMTLVASWDVTYDDGQPIPITQEALPDVPLTFRASVVNAIEEDMRGNAKAAKTAAQN
jgi:hypothetical protein